MHTIELKEDFDEKTIRIASLALAVTMATLGCTAQADQTTDKLKATLQARLGSDAPIKSVSSAGRGPYEVNLGSQIIYSDAAGDYVLLGDLVDTKTHKNLTDARLSEINKIDFASLPFANAIKVVKGNGARKIAVFSDPNCPYCKKLETTLQSVDNVTVYVPVPGAVAGFDREVEGDLVCDRPRETWQGLDARPRAPSGAGTCDTTALDKNPRTRPRDERHGHADDLPAGRPPPAGRRVGRPAQPGARLEQVTDHTPGRMAWPARRPHLPAPLVSAAVFDRPIATMTQPIRYSIVPKDLAAHLFRSVGDGHRSRPRRPALSLPVDSGHTRREFARNIVTLGAFNDAGRGADREDRHTWQVAP